jgi:chemotaxis signal transduction protein
MVRDADSMVPVIPVTKEIVAFQMGSTCAGIDLRALREIF